jgi:signal transduction protein with GAF and PtsI domain
MGSTHFEQLRTQLATNLVWRQRNLGAKEVNCEVLNLLDHLLKKHELDKSLSENWTNGDYADYAALARKLKDYVVSHDDKKKMELFMEDFVTGLSMHAK